MPYTQHLKAAEKRRHDAIDVAYLLSKGITPRRIRKGLKLSGRQFRKAKRAKATFSQPTTNEQTNG